VTPFFVLVIDRWVPQLPYIQRIFERYCSGFDRAVTRLEKLRPTLSTYEIDCRQLSRGKTNAWDLGSLICKPVQRVLKYPLLLEAILSSSHHQHPDRPNLQLALTRMLDIAAEINESKRRHELVGSIVGKRAVPHSKQSTPRVYDPAASRSFTHSVSKAFLRPPKSRTAEIEGQLSGDFELYDSLLARFDNQRDALQLFKTQVRAWSDSWLRLLRAQVPLIRRWETLYEPLEGDVELCGGGPGALRHFSRVVLPQLYTAWQDAVSYTSHLVAYGPL
jgi:RhoGEF domain